MDKKEIEESIKTFFEGELEFENPVTADARLKEDLGIDSLDWVDINVFVKKTFGVKLVREDMTDVSTFAQFIDYIERNLPS